MGFQPHLRTPRESSLPWRAQLSWSRREKSAPDVPASESQGVRKQPFPCSFQLDGSRIPFLLPPLGLFAVACSRNNTKRYRQQVDVGYDMYISKLKKYEHEEIMPSQQGDRVN